MMVKAQTIARKKIRRLYYTGTVVLLILTVISLALPSYFRIRNELEQKIEQLYEGIVNQKRAFLESTIVEKISDIERLYIQLEKQTPPLTAAELDHRFRLAAREIIHDTRLPDDGYIWINEIVDFEGGDNYAIRFAHPNLSDTEGDYLSTKTEDIKGNQPYLEELEGIKANGEVYFDYYFPKMNTDFISHKLTFAKLYRPYNWVVATGVYLDDVDALVEKESEKMKLSTKRTLGGIGIIIIIAGFVLTSMSVLFETRISQLIGGYMDALQDTNDKLNKEKTKLEEVNNQKDRIFSIISHDLSSPVGNLRLLNDHFASIIEQPEIELSVLTDLSRLINTSVESTSTLLENLLLWSRSQRNTMEFKPVRHPAVSHLNAALRVCTPIAEAKNIEIEQQGESSLAIVADPDMIRTVLRNLVSNAVKFTPSGGTISIEVSQTGSFVDYRIRDTGVGMSEEKVKSLFRLESIQSTRGTDSEKGSGLGLLLCKDFVDRHGGTINVISEPGSGSEFVVHLPIEQAIPESGD